MVGRMDRVRAETWNQRCPRDPKTKQMLSRLSPQAIHRWHSALLAGVCFYFEQFAEAGFWGLTSSRVATIFAVPRTLDRTRADSDRFSFLWVGRRSMRNSSIIR